MNNTVLTKTYQHFPFDKKLVLRFAGVTSSTPQIESLLKECLEEVKDKFVYKICFVECDIDTNESSIDFGLFKTDSKNLKNHLNNCTSAIIFAATVGLEIDKLIAKYSEISPSKALLLAAIGNERIEGLCDIFCKEIEEEGFKTTSRFSAGYGDLKLDTQKDLFRILQCHKTIGLTLNNSLIMSPTKSVTAIIGLKKD